MRKVLIQTAVEMLKLRAIGQQTNEGIHRAATDLIQTTLRNEVQRLKDKEASVQKEIELQNEAEGSCKTCQQS